MAFEPYLSERLLSDCQPKACAPSPFDPACRIDERRQLARDRQNLLCGQRCESAALQYDPCLKLSDNPHRPKPLPVPRTCASIDPQDCGKTILCNPPILEQGKTSYSRHYKYPESYYAIDCCCRPPCLGCEPPPEMPTNIYYCAKEPETCPPLDTCTTYREFYVPHQLEPREVIPKRPWDPCECPMEQCTTTRSEFTKKEPIPNGPAPAELLHNGLWSTSQFCKAFTDETTTGAEFGRKCAERRVPFKMIPNIGLCECCPMREDTTTRVDYRPKEGEDPCYPHWISNDEYRKPDTNLESCTTYKHFYRPHCIPDKLQSSEVGAPGAIPFCTVNNLCYSCHDPEINQKTPVEMRDNDPWPVVKTQQYRYTDNLQTDPCAPFRDETTYKTDYYAKTTCGRRPSFGPTVGYVQTMVPFNDDTTMKISYPAYNLCQYRDSVGNAGNPNGIKWDVYKCPPTTDKCLPRFVSPYGNPLKPFLQARCPCGPFDDRSSYNRDFIFRNREMMEAEEEATCRQLNVPKGDSLYRSSFIVPGGKKAAVMDPPSSKGYRCMHPCSFRDTDTLYRLSYNDFWKTLERSKLELYRGHSTHHPNEKKECQTEDDDTETQVVLVPVCQKKDTAPCQPPICPEPAEKDFKWPPMYRDIPYPYTGADIVKVKVPQICDR